MIGPRTASRRIARLLPIFGLMVFVAACKGKKEFEAPDRGERIVDAEERFRAASFDTVTWADDDARALAGNEVYAARCRNCHGPLGRGSTEYAAGRGLEVPSLVDETWSVSPQIDSVRHRVFVGHAAGMPTWGVAGITTREIDAVSFYVLERLRPEVLGGGG